MFMIVFFHVIVHGNIIENMSSSFFQGVFTILKVLTLVGVNSFIILTGYFQSKSNFKLKKFLFLIFLMFFYKVFIYGIFVLFGLIPLTIDSLVSNFFIDSEYWFVMYYVFLYLISVFLNMLIRKFNVKVYSLFIVLLTILFSFIPVLFDGTIIFNNGFTFIQFIYIYFIGGYIRMLDEIYSFKNNKKLRLFSIFSYLFMSMLIVVIYYLIKNLNVDNMVLNGILRHSFLYSSPLVIIQSISYFFIFKSFDFVNVKINKVSKYMICIYLIHDNILVRRNLYMLFSGFIINSNSLLFAVLFTFIISFLIFVVCYVINYIFDCILNKLKKDNQVD